MHPQPLGVPLCLQLGSSLPFFAPHELYKDVVHRCDAVDLLVPVKNSSSAVYRLSRGTSCSRTGYPRSSAMESTASRVIPASELPSRKGVST